ncbi:G2/mitotic-specific cyclin S13-7-like [Castanea sativa]|uniref:G2/mitotic-specific cyclin S13-7-like n=1 Tax=Castanea sativa TaxID=21020 RepID=UPI003F64FB9C
MEARAVLPPQPREEGKVKNDQGQRRNRRVLGDIGNQEVVRIAEAKHRPITRSYHAQLLANAQAEAEKKKNPTVAIVDDKVAVNRKHGTKKLVEAQKKAIDKPEPETIVVISSEEEKVRSVSGRKSRERSSRKEIKTLTAILTARSKVACGVRNKQDQIVNIDMGDENDDLAVAEYVDDIYKFYKLTEDESQVHDYMNSQPDINVKMRSILIDWLIDVHRRFELMPETLYLTINIVDRYLSKKIVSRRELQLVGMSSMLLACKYEESYCLKVDDLVCISDYAYPDTQILVMEKAILEKLEWYLTVPTPYVFLVRYIKASVAPDLEMENMVFFLAELGLMHYPTTILYCPSMIAAAAVFAANCTLNKTPFWSETLKHYSGYSEEQIMDCAKLLVEFHLSAAESKLKVVYGKYSCSDRGAVALVPPPKSLLARST